MRVGISLACRAASTLVLLISWVAQCHGQTNASQAFAFSIPQQSSPGISGIQGAVAACSVTQTCSILIPPTYSLNDKLPCRWNNIGNPISGEGCSSTMRSTLSLFDYRFGFTGQNVDGTGVSPSSNYHAWSRLDYILTAPLPLRDKQLWFTSKVGFNNNLLALDGGVNVNQSGYPNKAFYIPNDTRLHGYTPGQKIGYQSFVNSYAVGDAVAYYGISTCYGGFNAGGDEGCEGMDIQATQGTIEYSGNVASASSNTVRIDVTSGDGTQGAGRFLVDSSKAISAGKISRISGGSGSPLLMTGQGTNWPVSNVQTVLKTAIATPGPATVQVASSTGITTTSTLCVADAYELEQVVPTSVNASGFTAVFRYPHASGAIVAAGGLACHYIALTADVALPSIFRSTLTYELQSPLHWVVPVIRSTSPTSIEVWLQSPNSGYVTYRGRWTAANSAYEIYPGAQVTSVMENQKLSSKLTLEVPVSFNHGDRVFLPLYHNLNVYAALHGAQRVFPQVSGANPAAWWMNLSGLWTDVDAAIQINNSTPSSIYAGGKTQPVLIRPAGVAPQPWSYFLYAEKPASSAWLMSDNTTVASNVFMQSSIPATGFLASNPTQQTFSMANYTNTNFISFNWLKGNVEATGRVTAQGLALKTPAIRPVCEAGNEQNRGLFWFVPGPTGAKDHVEVCAQNATGILGWQQIY